MEALANAVGLRVFHSGFGMVNIIDSEEQLEVVLVNPATIFRASVSENSQHRQIVLFHERQHLVIEQVSSGDRRLGGVEFGMVLQSHLARLVFRFMDHFMRLWPNAKFVCVEYCRDSEI